MNQQEREEQALIQAGGIHPFPWEAKVNEDVGWFIVDANNEFVIPGPITKPVAKRVVELMNAHRVVFLDNDVVY